MFQILTLLYLKLKVINQILVEPFNSIKVTLKTVMRKEVDKTYQLFRICC